VKKIALFAHDAGGAEILLELLKASLHAGDFSVFCLKDSPCFRLLRAKHLEEFCQEIHEDKKDIVTKLSSFHPDLILYATGWQNHLEYHFLEYARAHHIPSVAFLDHWTNYRERFGYPEINWQNNLPDFIAAHDKVSEAKAKKFELPNVVGIKNYALLAQLKNFKSREQSDTLLFLSEPTSKVALNSFGDAYFWGFNEKEVFKNILTCKEKFECQNLIIRLHPSDSAQTYQELDKNATFSDVSLEEDIARAKVIIGIDTVALYTAFLLGKKVLSYIPSNKRDCQVPLPKTNQLRSFENFKLSQLQTIQEKPENFGIDFALFLEKYLGL